MKVSAENLVGATAKAIGVAFNLESDDSIGAGIGLNVVDVDEHGLGRRATRASRARGITVEAMTPDGKRNDFIVWGLAAAGGKSTASVAGSVADPGRSSSRRPPRSARARR